MTTLGSEDYTGFKNKKLNPATHYEYHGRGKVIFHNEHSNRHTIVEIKGRLRLGVPHGWTDVSSRVGAYIDPETAGFLLGG